MPPTFGPFAYEAYRLNNRKPAALLTSPDDAATLMAAWGHGSRVVAHGRTIWAEGDEELYARQCVEECAEIIRERAIALLG